MTSRVFVSYPKSGRTWVRYMLREMSIDNIAFNHDGFEFNDGNCPPHNFDIDARLSRYGPDLKLVYLERDPRDVMASLYHQVIGRFRDFFNYQGTISEFIRDDYFGAENLACFRKIWAEILADRPYLKISYEDLHSDTEGTMKGILDFYGFTKIDDNIRMVIEAGNIQNMRAVELKSEYDQPWLRPRNGHTKVRKGEVGGYKIELELKDIEYLNRVFSLS